MGALSSRAADLELVTAVRALDRGTAPAHQRVVELVFRLAALALDIHGWACAGFQEGAALPSDKLPRAIWRCRTSSKTRKGRPPAATAAAPRARPPARSVPIWTVPGLTMTPHAP